MIGNKILIKLKIGNAAIKAELTDIIRRISEFAIIPEVDKRKPDLLIYELEKDADKDISVIQSFIDKEAVGEIFLTSKLADPQILMMALRMIIKEFFPQPIDAEHVKKALSLHKERISKLGKQTASKSGQIITAFGSKGGVGTTTVAVNMAVNLSMNDIRPSVALIDMNTLFGEIPLFLEISPKFHWGEITKNIERLDHTFLSNILTKHQSGIHILPSPAYLNGHNRPTPSIMNRILDVMKGMFDYVIIDGGQSTDDTSLSILQKSNTLLLITILSLPCLTNTNKLIRSFTDLGYLNKEQVKVIVNRFMKKGQIQIDDAKKGIEQELFWIIPNDYKSTMSAINQGKPLSAVAPRTPITLSLQKFSDTFVHKEQDKRQEKKSGIFKMFASKN